MYYILDASCLIYLGKLKILDKLNNLDGKKFIPADVYKEVIEKGFKRGEPEADYIKELIEKKYFVLKEPEKIIKGDYQIDEADIKVISLALEIDAIAVIDDKKLRKIAELYNIKHHGTIYLIILLTSKKIITKNEAIDCIDKMIGLGFYLSVEKYKEIISIIEKL